MKSDIFVELDGKTSTEGPIILGCCANIPTAAELGTLLANDPQGISSDDARAKNWFVKFLAIVGRAVTAFPTAAGLEPWHFTVSYGKNGWSIPEGSQWQLFAFNMGSALTTGAVFLYAAEHFGIWLRD